MDLQKNPQNFSIFLFSFLFFYSAAFKVFRNHQQKYFFIFLQCREVDEFSLAFHTDLLCVFYNLIACLDSEKIMQIHCSTGQIHRRASWHLSVMNRTQMCSR